MEETGGDFPLTPLQGTYVIGIANGLFACIAFAYIGKIGRKPIFIVGQFAMGVFLFLCGLSILY